MQNNITLESLEKGKKMLTTQVNYHDGIVLHAKK